MRWPAWLGVGERRWKKSPDEEVQPPKTAWDFLQLLIVPAILVVIALAFNASQASRDRRREDRRIREDRALAEAAREDAVVDDYLATMRGLMLDRNLTRAKEGSAVRQVARTATLTTLRRLDGRRKGEVVLFLFEARLLHQFRLQPGQDLWTLPVIDLAGADLRGVDLAGASLEVNALAGPYDPPSRVSLIGDLRGARFDRAGLDGVDFGDADLRGASFKRASISDTRLSGFDLRGMSFKGAQLSGVNFEFSDLRGAVFDNAWIVLKTRFDATCLANASFAGAIFNQYLGGDPIPGRTTFRGAKGQDVDFSDAVNLSSVRLSLGVTEVDFEGAKERPKRIAKSPAGEASCR
jgi:uncharacterized protein YjbI with pentapeptide repeats